MDGNDVKVRIMDTSDYEVIFKIYFYNESFCIIYVQMLCNKQVMTENVVVCPSDLSADRYLGWADCVILVFSVVSAKSFIDLDVYLQVCFRSPTIL